MIKETTFIMEEEGERLRIKCLNSEYIFTLINGYLEKS